MDEHTRDSGEARRAVEAIGEGLVRWAYDEDTVESWEEYRARAYDRVRAMAEGILQPDEVREALGKRALRVLKIEHRERKRKGEAR